MGNKGKGGEHTFAAAVESIAETTFHLIGGTAFGVDGYVEFFNEGETNPCGKLIGVQVKTGSSHLRKNADGSYSFQGELAHLEYWRNHQLRIIVAFVDNGVTDGILWQEVTSSNFKVNPKSWSLSIDLENKVDKDSGRNWRAIAEKQTPHEAKFAQLSFAEPWMRLCNDGKVVAEFEEWINKSSGRGSMQIISVADDDSQKVIYEQSHCWGSRPYRDLFQKVFPWAEVSVDQDFYDVNYEDSELDAMSYDSDPEIQMMKRSLMCLRSAHLRLRGLES